MEFGALVWRPLSVAKLASHGNEWREVEDMVAMDEWVALRHPAYPDQVRVIGRTQLGRRLTEEQSEWLRQEAERTGMDLAAILRRLVDHSRAQG